MCNRWLWLFLWNWLLSNPRHFKLICYLQEYSRRDSKTTRTVQWIWDCYCCGCNKDIFCKRRVMVYTCKHCGKCFDGLSGLKRHKVIHSRKKPYVCSHCGKAFTDTSNCWQNKRTQHKKVTWEHAYRKKMQQTEHWH